MAELVFDIDVSGEGTIDDDVKAALAEINTAIKQSMGDIGGVMMDGLKKHINEDVYGKFTPKDYPRRSDNPKFGPPLNDVAGQSLAIFDETSPTGIGARVGIDYKPSGEHSGTTADLDPASDYYNPDNPRPIKAYPPRGDRVDADDLIRRIETGKGYTWRRRPGPRPFWTNFVNEMIEGRELERTFQWAMMSRGMEVSLIDSGVVREPGDGDY